MCKGGENFCFCHERMTRNKMSKPKKWGNTTWRTLPNGQTVNVIDHDEVAVISVHFTDKRELTRDFPIALNGRVIDFIEVDGRRWVEPPEYHESCEVVD